MNDCLTGFKRDNGELWQFGKFQLLTSVVMRYRDLRAENEHGSVVHKYNFLEMSGKMCRGFIPIQKFPTEPELGVDLNLILT